MSTKVRNLIALALIIISMSLTACNLDTGCQSKDPVTGVCVDNSPTNDNPISEGAKSLLCTEQTNPDWDKYCK